MNILGYTTIGGGRYGRRTVTVVVLEAAVPRSSTALQVTMMVAGESAKVCSVALDAPATSLPEDALKL